MEQYNHCRRFVASLIPVTMAVSSLSCVRLSMRGCATKAASDEGGKTLCSTTLVSRSTARFDGLPSPAIYIHSD